MKKYFLAVILAAVCFGIAPGNANGISQYKSFEEAVKEHNFREDGYFYLIEHSGDPVLFYGSIKQGDTDPRYKILVWALKGAINTSRDYEGLTFTRLPVPKETSFGIPKCLYGYFGESKEVGTPPEYFCYSKSTHRYFVGIRQNNEI